MRLTSASTQKGRVGRGPKSKVTVLLGAGASIDAGLPDTNRLTSVVYEKLVAAYDKAPATVFGYVVSKLVARGARVGGSPFAQVNIEQAYDTVLRLLNRDNDPLSEFVYSWDPILDSVKQRFNERSFAQHLTRSMAIDTRRSFTGSPHITFNSFELEGAAKEISKAFSSDQLGEQGRRRLLPPILSALVTILSEPARRTDYLQQLIDFAKHNCEAIATLNYDTYLEGQADQVGVPYDYGLSNWNERKLLDWSTSSLKILKLHGSINWFGRGDQIALTKPQGYLYDVRWMIFGGQSDKLNPEGPFLQLRSEFEAVLLRSDSLLIIGYSRGDAHLNALIRSWVGTRKQAKLVVLDPGDVVFSQEVFGLPFQVNEDRITRRTVEFQHIKATAAEGMTEALLQALSPPKLEEIGSNASTAARVPRPAGRRAASSKKPKD